MEIQSHNQKPVLIRRREVEARTGLARSTIYGRLTLDPRRPEQYDPTFPKPIKLGRRHAAWVAAEIDAWIASQIAKRDAAGVSDAEG